MFKSNAFTILFFHYLKFFEKNTMILLQRFKEFFLQITWSIRKLFNRHNKRKRIIFMKQLVMNVYFPLAVFPDFKVVCNREELNDCIYYVPLGIINISRFPIIEDKQARIIFQLDSGCKWIDFQVTKKSTNLECEVEIQGESMTLTFEKFDRNHFILIKSLVKTNSFIEDTDSFFKKLQILNSIPSHLKIKRKLILTEVELQLQRKKFYRIFEETALPLFFTFIVILFMLVYFRSCTINSKLEYFTYHSGVPEVVTVVPADDTTIFITNVKGEKNYKVPIKEFQNSLAYKPFIKPYSVAHNASQPFNKLMAGLAGLIIIILIFRYLPFQKRKIYKQIYDSKKKK